MRGRRRLLLLAVIIVAVAIGAVGITIVSLFEAGVAARREALAAQTLELAQGMLPDRHAASLARGTTGWKIALGEAPPAVLAALPSAPSPAGEPVWLEVPGYLVVWRGVDADAAVLSWASLAEMRAPFQRAALHATAGIVLLLVLGLALFYRTTAPLLRSIERSEARYRTLFANTAEGVVLIGSGIQECNDRFCEMFRCRRHDVVGLPWRDFFRRYAGGAQGLESFEQRVEAVRAAGGGPFTWEFRVGDGERLVLDVAVRELRNEGLPRVLVSLRDVTAREETGRVLRAAEQALRESREKLAQAGRSSALVELAAGIAHEVNQPLAAIANYARAGQRMVGSGRADSEELAQALERIAVQAQRAGEAIHRIRALVSVPSPEAADRTCINRLVQEVVDLMADEIASHGARVEIVPGQDMVPVIADPLQIQQVVMQLLRNALESMDGLAPPARRVRIDTRRLGDQVEVTIEDCGCGIGADDRSRMFEPFYSTKEAGMGMGLPISMSIIRSHHGELAVDEVDAGGTRVRFRLPADVHGTDACAPDDDQAGVSARDQAGPAS